MLNKLGKIGVIVGFCLGNAILTYVANGNTIAVITIREILIASLGLLLLPKNVNIDIADIVGKTKLLPVTGGVLEGDTKTVEKLNTVSETISEIAKSYQEVAATTAETEEELQEDAKKYFKEELLNNLEDFSPRDVAVVFFGVRLRLLEAAEAALVGGGRQEGPEKIRVALAQQTLGIVRPLAVRVVCDLVQHRKGLRLPDARVDLLHHTDKVVGDLADVLRPAFPDE